MIASVDATVLAIGTYTSATGGRGPGVALVDRDPVTGRLGAVGAVDDCPSPSFLTLGAGGIVHAAHEVEQGFVSSRRVGPRGWELLGEGPSGGSFPCHVAVAGSSTGRFLVAANYGGGVGVLDLVDGVVAGLRQTLTAQGSGPDSDRQEASHPHSTVGVGDTVAVLDLGTDEIRVHGLSDEGLSTEPVAVVALPPGTGPRHAARQGEDLFVAGELDLTVTSLRAGSVRGVSPAIAVPVVERTYPSEICSAPWGLVVANRRAEVLTLHEIVDGIARPVRDVPLGVVNPRHVAVVGRHVYVAAQDSDRLVHLALDDDLTVRDRSEVEIGSPACVLPL